jgi:hypothetical protein
MDRTSVRAISEWVVAAAILAGILAGGSLAVREYRTVAAILPVSARAAVAPQVPTAAVPSGAVSVPVLLLANQVEIRVGDAATDALRRLADARDLVTPSAERGPTGDRQTRTMMLAGTRFVLVIEPFENDAEPRVAAIYLP